jgi:hypothetical protein
MLTVIESDGRVSSYSRDTELDCWDLWSRKYVMLGCQYYLEVCRDEVLKQEIVECMKPDRLYTISEMLKEFPCCEGLTAPKVTAIFTRLLIPEGVAVNTKDKRKSYYSLA